MVPKLGVGQRKRVRRKSPTSTGKRHQYQQLLRQEAQIWCAADQVIPNASIEALHREVIQLEKNLAAVKGL